MYHHMLKMLVSIVNYGRPFIPNIDMDKILSTLKVELCAVLVTNCDLVESSIIHDCIKRNIFLSSKEDGSTNKASMNLDKSI